MLKIKMWLTGDRWEWRLIWEPKASHEPEETLWVGDCVSADAAFRAAHDAFRAESA